MPPLSRPADAGGWRRWKKTMGAALAVLAVAAAVFLAQRPGAPQGSDPSADALAAQLEQTLQGRAAPVAADNLESQLQAQLQRHPSDVRALVLKARLDMEAQRFGPAVAGYEKALGIANSKAARDPGVWVEYAEAVGMQQGGILAGKPLQLVEKALALDPGHGPALDLAGSAAWEAQDFTAAAVYWKRLLGQLPAGSARHGELAAAIRKAEQRARLSLPRPREPSIRSP